MATIMRIQRRNPYLKYPLTMHMVVAMKEVARKYGFLHVSVGSNEEMIAELKRRSEQRAKDCFLLFYVNGKAKFFYRHINPDGEIGGWVNEFASVSAKAYVDWYSIVGESYIGDGVTIKNRVVPDGERITRHDELKKYLIG